MTRDYAEQQLLVARSTEARALAEHRKREAELDEARTAWHRAQAVWLNSRSSRLAWEQWLEAAGLRQIGRVGA